MVYEELRALARRQRAGHAALTLSTTALVHEAFLRLVDSDRVVTSGRAYFFGAAARAMQQILVDHARRRQYAKRAGIPVTLDAEMASIDAGCRCGARFKVRATRKLASSVLTQLQRREP